MAGKVQERLVLVVASQSETVLGRWPVFTSSHVTQTGMCLGPKPAIYYPSPFKSKNKYLGCVLGLVFFLRLKIGACHIPMGSRPALPCPCCKAWSGLLIPAKF